MMFGTSGFQKNINVIVGGNVTAYNRAMTGALAATNKFRLGVAAMGVVVAATSVTILSKSVKAATEFEATMAGVKAVTASTTEQFSMMEAEAKRLGRITKFTMVDIASGMENLGRAGFKPVEILGAMSGVADMAAASSISLSEAADIASKTIRAFNLDASEAGRVADVLAKAAANSNVTVPMLGDSLKYVAPLAEAAGFSLEQTVAAIGKLGDIGIQGSMAGTSLRQTFSEMLAETAGFTEVIDELGMSMADLTGSDGEMIAFTEILQKLSDAGADVGDVIELVGKRAGPAVWGLIRNNPELQQFVEELKNAEGAAKAMADIRLDTLSGQLEILQGSWQLLLVTIGEKIIPILQVFVQDTLIPAVNEFVEWAASSNALESALETLFEKMVSGFRWMIDNYEYVVDGLNAIKVAIMALFAVKVISGLATLVTSLTAVGAASAAAGAGAAAGGIGIGAAGAAAGTAGAVVGGLVSALGAAGVAFGLALVPLKRWVINSREAKREAEDLFDAMNDLEGTISEHSDAVALIGGAYNNARDELKKMVFVLAEAGTSYHAVEGQLRDLSNEVKASGASASEMADMWAAGLQKILQDLGIATVGVFDLLDQWQEKSIETAKAIGDALSGAFSFTFGEDRLGTTGFGSFGGNGPRIDTPTSFTTVPTPVFITNPLTNPNDVAGTTTGGDTGTTGGDTGTTGGDTGDLGDPGSILNVTAWKDALDELQTVMSDEPTKATSKLVSFMDEFGGIPAAFLSGKSAARSLLGKLEELNGAFDVGADIGKLEDILGFEPIAESIKTDVSALQKSLDAVDFNNPIQALNELLAIGENVASPTELAMVGSSLSSLESFVSGIANLPDELKPEEWESVVARFEALRSKADQAVQGFLSPEDLQSAWTNLKEINTPLGEMVGLFTDYAMELEDQPELLKAIYSLIQDEMMAKESLLAVQEAFGLATGDTTAEIDILRSALGMTGDAADEAASSLYQAAGAAKTLSQTMQAQSVAQAASVVGTVEQLIEDLARGTERTDETVSLGQPVSGQIGLPENVTIETPLTLGDIADKTADITGAVNLISTSREAMYDLGLGATESGQRIEALNQTLQAFVSGMNPEEMAAEAERAADAAAQAATRAQDEASKKTASAEAEAASNAKQAAADAVTAAKESAQAMKDAFLAKFSDPIAAALGSGDWVGAAAGVTAMAQNFAGLTAEAEALNEVLGASGIEQIEQLDILGELTGMERALTSALKSRIALAELAGDVDLAASLQTTLDSIFAAPEVEKTWREKADEWLSKGWGSIIESTISILPEKLQRLASGLFTVLSTALTDPLAAIAAAITFVFEMFTGALQDQIDSLNEELKELKAKQSELVDTLSFYVEVLRGAAQLIDKVFSKFGAIGDLAGATMTAFISSIEMLSLNGLDLLRAGMSMLTSFVGSLIDTITGLIEKSDAYTAVQSEGARMWTAVSNLLGQFLWPLAALMKQILDWLGIQDAVNEAAKVAEIGVPSAWKRQARVFEAAEPGQLVEDDDDTTGIPDWAMALVEPIAEAIKGVLGEFGIDSWPALLEQFRQGSVEFWTYVTTKIPEIVAAMSSIFQTIRDAIGGDVVAGIVGLLTRGFDWLINDGPRAVQAGVSFISDLFGLLGSVWEWLQDLGLENLIDDIKAKFTQFQEELENLESLQDLVTGIGDVAASIDKVESAIDRVKEQLESLKSTLAIVFVTVGAGIVGALAGMATTLLTPLGGARVTAGALLGISAGLITSGILTHLNVFDGGGVVPGQIGKPSLIMAKGGEEVMTYEERRYGSGGGSTEVHVYVGGKEVTDYTVRSIQRRGKALTGRSSTAAGLRAR